MYRVTYDEGKNRIYIQIEGSLGEQELQNYAEDLLALIDLTSPGFTVCADLSKGCVQVLKEIGKLKRIREYGALKGVGTVAHVLDEKAREMHRLNPFEGVKHVFHTVAEADAFLETVTIQR